MSKVRFSAETLGFLRAPRDVIVYLPADYAASEAQRYPVLYLHDGQNLFDPATAFAGNEWGLEQLADEMTGAGAIEPVILVGIYNTGDARIDEYTPVKDRRGRGGGAKRYGQMIVEDLKPFIDRTYRTKPEPVSTALGGSSLGGLVTLYLGLFPYSNVFGKLIVMSPSLWWASGAILRRIRNLRKKLPAKIWLDTGTSEGQNPEACVRHARELNRLLIEKGWRPGSDLAYFEEEGAGHNEQAWGLRMRQALSFLFPAHRE